MKAKKFTVLGQHANYHTWDLRPFARHTVAGDALETLNNLIVEARRVLGGASTKEVSQ